MRVAALLVVVALIAAVGACGGPEPTSWPEAGDVSARPATSSAPAVSAVAVKPRTTSRAWNDDASIAALARDCGWQSACLAEVAEAAGKSEEILQGVSAACEPWVPLACARFPMQSCAPDACAQVDSHCVPECNRLCGQCSDGCTASCETCKATCEGEACRLACARSCAACHDGCLKEVDRCSTAGCAAEAEACFDGEAAAWEATACAKVCPAVTTCVEKCPRKDGAHEYEHFGTACVEGCFTRLAKGCPSTFAAICKGGDAGGFFHSWYDLRKKRQ